MQVLIGQLIAQTGGGGSPGTLTRGQFIGHWALYMLILTIILLLMVVAMLSVALARRRMVERKRSRRRGGGGEESGRGPDPWIEAGRRAATPTAQQLGDPPAGSAVELPEERLVASPLTGKRPVAIVTGGARRVGRAICLALAKSGCDVVFTYHSSEEDARSLVGELKRAGSDAACHRVDFLNLDEMELFASFLADTLPRLDVLVHNASVYTATPLHDLATEEAVQQLSVNALSPLILTARLAPLLRQCDRKGGGAIVAMADIHAMGRPRKDFIAYSMSKAALVELVYSAAKELAPDVRVNGVAPGVVAWPEAGDEADESAQSKYLKRVPLARAGTPDDAAEAVRWLAMDAHYTTGQILRVDGGRWVT